MKARECAALLGACFIYACESIFTKLASTQEPMSLPWIACIGGAVAVLGVYAIIWQQIIKRVPVSDAYMFKGSSLIFVMLFSVIFFGDSITQTNVIGAAMIVGGICLFAKS